MRPVTSPYAFRFELDKALAERMPPVPPPDEPVRLKRNAFLPPPSSTPRTQRSQVPLPSTIRPAASQARRPHGDADDTGSSNQGPLRYLHLLPSREEVARRVSAPEPVIEPDPALPPTPQELDFFLPVVSTPPAVVSPTIESEEMEAPGDLSVTFRRWGSLRWLAAAGGGLSLAAAGLVALAVLLVGAALFNEDPARPGVTVRAADVVITSAAPAAPDTAEPMIHTFAPETISRSTTRRGERRRHVRRRHRRRRTVDPDALLATSRTRPVADALLATSRTRPVVVSLTPRRSRRPSSGIQLPTWTH